MQNSRMIELPKPGSRQSRQSTGSNGSNRIRFAGQSIMGSVPQSDQIKIPTGGFASNTSSNHNLTGCDFFEDEPFYFGSPQKKQPRQSFEADNLTQESTPEKDIIMS